MTSFSVHFGRVSMLQVRPGCLGDGDRRHQVCDKGIQDLNDEIVYMQGMSRQSFHCFGRMGQLLCRLAMTA